MSKDLLCEKEFNCNVFGHRLRNHNIEILYSHLYVFIAAVHMCLCVYSSCTYVFIAPVHLANLSSISILEYHVNKMF